MKEMQKIFLSFSLVVVLTRLSVIQAIHHEYPHQIESIGCFESEPPNLPSLILTGRDWHSGVFYSTMDWQDYNHWLSAFLCECVSTILSQKPWSNEEYISINFYGECWGKLNDDKGKKLEIPSLKVSDHCISGEFNQFTGDRASCKPFTGGANAMFLYKVKRTGKKCEQFFTSVGCKTNKDTQSGAGATKLFTGKSLGNEKLLCKCAEETKESGHQFFEVNSKGECLAWRYDQSKELELSSICKQSMNLLSCKPGLHNPHKQCTVDLFNAGSEPRVYKIHQGPLACLSDPCLNDGICNSSSLEHFQCKCKKGAYGKTCEQETHDGCEDCD